MLSDRTSSAIVAVSDLRRARHFYEDILGLCATEGTGEELAVYRTGATHLVVYRSEHAGTNRANAVVFDADGRIEEIVADLRARGVRFERYEMEGVEYREGIHEADGFKMVWFEDPDRNIIHVNQMPRGEEAR